LRVIRRALFAALLGLSRPCEMVAAQSGESVEDALGFGDAQIANRPQAAEVTPAQVPATAESMTASAYAISELALQAEQTHPSRVSMLRGTLGARLNFVHRVRAAVVLRAMASARVEYDAAYLIERERWDEPSLEVYELLLLPEETYVGLKLGFFQLTFGKQIVTWGQGLMLSAVDVTNPRDQRRPGLGDLADLRIAVLMTRAELALGRKRLELLAVHEPKFGLLPPPLGVWSPMRKLFTDQLRASGALADRALRYRHVPGQVLFDLAATQLYGRLLLSGRGVDLTFQAAYLLDGLGVPGQPEPDGERDLILPLYHPRYWMFAQTGVVALGPCLLRWELSLDLNRALSLRRTDGRFLDLTYRRRHQVHGLLGLSYVPSARTSATLEIMQGYVYDSGSLSHHNLAPLWPIHAVNLAVRLEQRFLRERASLRLFGILIGLRDPNALLVRGELAYALREGLELGFGYVTYRPSDSFGPFYGFTEHDQVFVSLRTDF
jgi:hypothetical protein